MSEKQNNPDLYQELSNRIQQEEEDYFSSVLSVLLNDSNEESDDSWLTHERKMIALRSHRAAVLCERIPAVGAGYEDELRFDLEELLNSVKGVEYKGEIDDEVVSDVLDCICATSNNENLHKVICGYIESEHRCQHIAEKEISENLYFLLTSIADYFFYISDISVMALVLQYLVKISRQRNRDVPDKHRQIVVNVLARLCDICLEDSYQISISEQNYFKDIQDEYTADFLWFSGCTMYNKGKAESARKVFINCYDIRRKLYGDEDWFTVLARREYSVITLSSGDIDSKECYQFLVRFINVIEENGYSEIDVDTLRIMEGKTLCAILKYKLDHNDLCCYQHYLNIYHKICERYNSLDSEPAIKLRLSRNFLGGFYFKTGNYIQAEQAFQDAVNAPFPDDAVEIVSKAQIKSNLLMIYYVENDLEQAIPLLLNLFDLVDDEGAGLTIRDEYRILILYMSLIIQAFLEPDKEEMDDIKSELESLDYELFENDLLSEDYAAELILFAITSVLLLIHNSLVTAADCKKYYKLLTKIERTKKKDLESGQQVLFYLVLSVVAWELDEPAAVDYIQESVKLLDGAVIPMATRASVLQTAALILSKRGKANIALSYLRRSLEQITDIWHSYMRYFNDNRLLQILSPTQFIFASCYVIMRQQESDTWALYEYVLKYKALAALAGKERNKILSRGVADKGLVSRIKVIQDRMAALESGNLFLKASAEYEKEKAHLRNLESQFASQFPDKIDFTEITVKNLKTVIPDNVAVIEYYICARQYGARMMDDDTGVVIFDVFVLRKTDGQCSLQKISIPDAEIVIEEIQEFVRILQDESGRKETINQLERKEILRLSLYHSLIEPIKSNLSGIRRVYVAPDSDMMNLPFDILCSEDGDLFGDSFNIVKMECARDFLFGFDNSSQRAGSLIIGNPQFEVKETGGTEKEVDGMDKMQSAKLKAENISPLPFSEFEAQLVGKYCGSKYITGKAANRKRLLQGGVNSNIHLATHGYYDLSEDTDSIYSSCLLFAGVKNWLRTGSIHDEYGNGIVTADEISRLDLHKVELVVLSACLSGMNDTMYSKGFQGLIGGFSAAGVKYVISNLWNADDLATTIFMDVFYYQYSIKRLPPPVALRKAKQYLRKVTMGELKKRRWFDDMLKSDTLSLEVRNIVSTYMSKNDKFRPFKNEVYWAGFTCFRCNG